MTPEHQEALALIKEGFYIFPLHLSKRMSDGTILCTCGRDGCTGKHPIIRFSEKATATKESVDYWWSRFTQAPIGIHLGRSHAWVLDIDGPAGMAELDALLKEHGSLPATRTVRTGSGNGLHYYFAAWVDKIHSGYLTENIHIKGNIGSALVVAPPSQHVSGNRYEYINRCNPVDAPEWLLSLINQNTTRINGIEITPEMIAARKEYEIPIYQILSKEQLAALHKEGDSLIGYHPIHNKGTPADREFSISLSHNRWHCFVHETNGGLFELAAMLSGICSCQDLKRIDESTRPLSGENFKESMRYCLERGIALDDLEQHMNASRIVRGKKYLESAVQS